MIALDTETGGLDHYHGSAEPFLVTTCDREGVNKFWEWDVDPLTRRTHVPADDLAEIAVCLTSADGLALQNAKFDCTSLELLYEARGCRLPWDWSKVDDTLIAGHVLHSAQRHDLTSMSLLYLGVDIQPFEDRLEEAVKECRRVVQQARLKVKRGKAEAVDEELAGWRIAEEGLPEMPSARGGSGKTERGAEAQSPWKFDAWLPRAYAKWAGLPEDHRYWKVCADYANADSGVTLPLWIVMEKELRQRRLWDIYAKSRRQLPEIMHDLQRRGATFSMSRLELLRGEYRVASEARRQECLKVAAELKYDLELPKGASPNGSLRTFCFEVLKLPPIRGFKAKTEAPTLDKNAMATYQATLDPATVQGRFVNTLLAGRKFDTALGYIDGYEKYGIGEGDVRVLHYNSNATGTDTLRWSFSNPNLSQVSKQEDAAGKTLRYILGPAEGREWWKMDYENLELRIPAYRGGVQKMIDLFERPDDPPFFGSYHLLNASVVYPDLFWPLAETKGAFKKCYEATWYQCIKNAGFALIYGCQEETFDRTAHKAGAYMLLKRELPDLFAYADRWIAHAEKHSCVETIPDVEVDPLRGYPLECVRSEWGRVSPTVPLNYVIQGTAMQCTNKAMLRCYPRLKGWSRPGREFFMTIQQHDELVFDFPKGGRRNLPKVMALKHLMEMSGEDINVPLKVSVSYHPNNWGEAEEY